MQDLADLFVTQDRVRPGVPLAGMIDFVRAGGRFTCEAMAPHLCDPTLVQISVFEDGRKFVHDGHHRCVAAHLGGRRHLLSEEFVVRGWTYAEYGAINPACGYVTPFDPRIEVRLADCRDYKIEARRLFALAAEGAFALEEALAFVHASHGRYKVPRQLWSVLELSATFTA